MNNVKRNISWTIFVPKLYETPSNGINVEYDYKFSKS